MWRKTAQKGARQTLLQKERQAPPPRRVKGEIAGAGSEGGKEWELTGVIYEAAKLTGVGGGGREWGGAGER